MARRLLTGLVILTAFTLMAVAPIQGHPQSENTIPLSPGKQENGSIPAPTGNDCVLGQIQYSFAALPGAGISIGLVGDQNVDLYIRFGQRVTVEDGRIVADYISRSSGNREEIPFDPVQQGGIYFVAISNCSSQTANYTLTYSLIVVDPPFNFPVVTDCLLKRTETGDFALVIDGTNIRMGGTVEIGGITPKSVKYKRPEAFTGGTTFSKVKAMGRVCRGLPGIITITNPGPFGQRSQPFMCFQKCPD